MCDQDQHQLRSSFSQAILKALDLGSGDTISVGVIKRHPHLHLRVCKVPHADAASGAVPIGVRQISAQLMPNGKVEVPASKSVRGGLNIPVSAMRHLGLTEAGEVTVVLSDGQEHLRNLTCRGGAGAIKGQWRPIMDALRLQPGQYINIHAEERGSSTRLHIVNATDPQPPNIVAAPSQMVSLKPPS